MFRKIVTLVSVLVMVNISFSQQCDIKFSRYSQDHTACLQSATPTSSGVTTAQKDFIVDRHNFFRAHVHMYNNQPTATDMQKMYWDDELAMIAQKWADHCEWKHDKGYNRAVPGSYSVGQNLARGQSKWENVIQDWQSEVQYLNFGVGGTPGEMIGHYTQLVWADSARIGCGFTDCGPSFGRMYVCNYAPGGNFVSKMFSPYNNGNRGADCAAQYLTSDGLCDCRGKVCKNGGKLNLQTCECECKNRAWIVGDDCSLDCSKASDYSVCRTQGWGMDACRQYSNVPYEYCPMMCNLCPDPNTVATTPAAQTVAPVTTKAPAPAPSGLPKCLSIESAQCGQPSSFYYPKEYCSYSFIKNLCPAMCETCAAEQCQDYYGDTFTPGSTWRNTFGTFTCTPGGVLLERGCYIQQLDVVIGVGETSPTYQENGFSWTCTCQAGHGKSCSGQSAGR